MWQDAFERRDGSLLRDALRSLTRFVSRRPKITLSLVVLLACASAVFTVRYLDFRTERADLIDPNTPFQRRWMSYTESFGDAADIIVVVEADNPETIKQVLDDLGSRMVKESDLFTNVLYKIEPGRLPNKGLQYLNPEQLEAGLERFAEFSPVLQGRWELVKIASLFARLRYQIESPSKNASPDELKPLLRHAKLLTSSMARYLEDRNDFQSPWPDILPLDPRKREEAKQVIYLLNDQGTMGFLKAFPAEKATGFNGASASIDRLRELIADVSASHPSATIGVTGIPVLENDEMRRSQQDMLKASMISFLGVGLLLCLGFRGVRHPMLSLLMLVIGTSWAFGYATLVIGHLNILSVSFAVILIGLGIDFGIHYLARYLELRHSGELLRPALLETSASVGTGIITAAVTTALAFFCATFTQFLGVAELGIIVGGSILLCAAATFVVLPALITLADQHLDPRKLPTPFQGNLLRLLTSRHPVIVTLVSCLVIAGVGAQAFQVVDGRIDARVSYDYNLLNLQAEELESVNVQKRVFQNANNSLLFAVSVADTPAEARELRARFEALPTVHHVEELASRLPVYPPEETQLLVQAFQAQSARLPQQPPQFESTNPALTGGAMEEFFLVIRSREDPLSVKVARTVDTFLDGLEKLSLKDQIVFLDDYQQRVTASLLDQFQALAGASNPEPVTLHDLPSELTSRFVSRQGKWLVQVYPKDQVWDVGPLSRFVADVRSVDPGVTGTPLQNFEATRQIMDSYKSAALYALAVICLVLLVDFLDRDYKLLTLLPPAAVIVIAAIALPSRFAELSPVFVVTSYIGMAVAIAAVLDFRNLRDAVLTMLPPLAGGLLMFGMLAVLDIDLNPANLIVLPLVLGIGVDDGVHVVHDFRMQTRRYRMSSSTINAIVLTSLTSMIGFGSMMVAAHRGLYSVGLVLVIGIGSCLFVSLVPLPAILTLVARRQPTPAQTAERDEITGAKQPAKTRTANAA